MPRVVDCPGDLLPSSIAAAAASSSSYVPAFSYFKSNRINISLQFSAQHRDKK